MRREVPETERRRIEASAMAEEGEASVSRKKTRITPPPPPSSVPHGTGSNGSFGDIDEISIEESQGNGVNLDSAVGTEFAEEHEEEPMDTSPGVDEQVSPKPASPSPVVADVTVTDDDALRCGVCFLALRPPIFQCEVGHVVCPCCRDKLEEESAAVAAGNKCHVCGVAMTRGYSRCHAMERLVDSICVPCPYAAHGGVATPAYHGRDAHALACPHAPCPCPDKACGFSGSTAALLEHFAATHNWPITTNVRAGERFTARLRFGFNFVLLADDGGVDQKRLFLLNWTRESLGDAVSVICIHPHATGSASDAQSQCELVFSRYGDDGTLYTRHYQKSEFQVDCTDLFDGMAARASLSSRYSTASSSSSSTVCQIP